MTTCIRLTDGHMSERKTGLKPMLALISLSLVVGCDQIAQRLQEPRNAPVEVAAVPSEAPSQPKPVASPAPAVDTCLSDVEVNAVSIILEPGGCIRSPNGKIILHFTLTSTLELIKIGDVSTELLWSSDNPAADSFKLAIQSDGNLVIYSSDGLPVWSLGVAGRVGPLTLEVRDDGIVSYTDLSDGEPNGSQVWSLPQ